MFSTIISTAKRACRQRGRSY